MSRLPQAVIGLRTRIFAAVNGPEGIPIPGPLVGVDQFRAVYEHPAANGRSAGAGLSDLFWYWLAPGPQVHQEHLEAGPRYDEAARATRRFLARPRPDVAELTERVARSVLDELDVRDLRLVRLRDLMMPIWAEVSYELVFGERCPAHARALIVANANDVITALKCCGLRHLRKRDRLTRYLRSRLTDTVHPLPGSLSAEEQAWYLQGAFFNTAVVQMSEAMTHLLLALAQHTAVQERFAASEVSGAYAGHVIDETMRCFPLFGVAHRITTDDIVVDARTTLPRGSVLCFNYPAYHSAGFSEPERFDPSRWETLSARDAHHIPFGVTANRPCPARGVAPLMMEIVAREVLRRFELASTAEHTRSIPNRGPCLLVARTCPVNAGRRGRLLAYLRIRDRWEDVWRSVVQLVLGTYMVIDARRQRLAATYFDREGVAWRSSESVSAGPERSR
ncbi:cytochrome P450 [Flindersiella endophytica]